MYVMPSKEAWEKIMAEDREGPIHMLNLIRYRDKAEYSDGRESDLTGEEAYGEYGRQTGPLVKKVGGNIVWRGNPEQTVVGAPEEAWDLAFIVEYPNLQAFMSMMRDPEYREIVKHREAAVLDSRLIRLAPLPVGSNWSE